jgi:hypothetical protein
MSRLLDQVMGVEPQNMKSAKKREAMTACLRTLSVSWLDLAKLQRRLP